MNWAELIIHTTTAGSDWVSDLLVELGATGTMIEDRADIPDPSRPHGIWEIVDPKLLEEMPEDVLVHAWFEPDAGFPELLSRLSARLESHRGQHPEFGSLRLDTRNVREEDWAELWKQYYKTFHLSKHILIKPTWETCTPAPGEHVIEIDSGMAFGSGFHETTALCMQLLEDTLQPGDTVIDVGTGSGILAIGAALLGAGKVLAVDVDPDAVRVAANNVAHNGVADRVAVRQGDLLSGMDDVCRIAVVNIIADVAMSFAGPLKKNIEPGGYYIASGIVRDRADEVRRALTAAGYRICREEYRGDWAAFLAGREP